jgi:type IV pilus assembly protein PilA
VADETLWRILDTQQREHGPFTADQIRTGLSEGSISRDAHFWKDGMTAWAPLSAVARELGVVIVGSKVTEKKKGMSGCLIAAIVIGGLMLLFVPIFAAIAISQYQDYVIRSQVYEGSALADGAKTAVGEYLANNEAAMPADNAAAGLAEAAEINGAYVGSLAIIDGRIVATYSTTPPQKANQAIDGKSLEFTPVVEGDSVRWECSSDTLKQKWCPSSCTCSG